METLQWVILAFAIITLLSALIIFLRHSVFGEILSNCCSQLCNASDHHQVSHLDTYNLRVHYKCDQREVVIEGLELDNKASGYNNPAYTSGDTDIILSPLPANLRSQCPTATCQVTYSGQK